MEETQAPQTRSLDDVNQEYTKMACEVGDMQFKIQNLGKQIGKHLDKMELLNQEASFVRTLAHALKDRPAPPASAAN